MKNILVQDLIDQLKDVENGDLWLDENFEKKLSAIDHEEAFVRPLPDLHSAAELLSHLITWRRVNIRRMHGETLEIPIDHPDNWKSNDELRPEGWDTLRNDFFASQQELIDLLQDKNDDYLETLSTHYGKNFKYLVQGLIHHDFYHLGQLGLTIKYLKEKRR